jgi:hypothetical protein
MNSEHVESTINQYKQIIETLKLSIQELENKIEALLNSQNDL